VYGVCYKIVYYSMSGKMAITGEDVLCHEPQASGVIHQNE
jgi:hypothetical protein